MTNQSAASGTRPLWQAKQVYVMAAVCFVVGLIVGYLLHAPATAHVATLPNSGIPLQGQEIARRKMPSLEQMKRMADKKAEPLLAKLKTDPNNADLLAQIGGIYQATHQFKEASEYYDKALQINPKKVATRTEMASCLYYGGDVDGALAQLQQALKDDPKDVNSLFNLGMIKWEGKKDGPGAIQAWQRLLQLNPNLEKKPMVEQMIAEAKQQSGDTAPIAPH